MNAWRYSPDAEHQLEYAEVPVDLSYRVSGKRIPQLAQFTSARSGDDLFDSIHGVRDAPWCLR